LFQEPDFFISNDQLFHLARVKGKKRLHEMAPRFQQLVVPKHLRMQIMKYIHEFSHFGFLKSYLTARQKYYWPQMASQFKLFTDSCLVCQQVKSSPAPHYPVKGIPVGGLFETLQIDFHEIRHPKNNPHPNAYKHVLIMVDQFSQFITLCLRKI
jgi:Integrase zinc binding domain